MAKKSIIEREKKRIKLYEKFKSKRFKIIDQLKSTEINDDEKWALRLQLQKFPRNANPTRITKRCFLTGRAKAIYSRFGLSRIKIRENAMEGKIPGIIKSSW